MRTTHWTTLAALALVSIQAACTIEGAAKEPARDEPQATQAAAAAPALVTITARDFAFDAPETLPAGLATIRLVNQGPDMHHVQLVRLEDGKTVQDLIDAASSHGEDLPAWAHFVGGPNLPAPGGHSEATVNLEPGSYAIVCLIPTDGVVHLMKGMIKPLAVLPAQSPAAAAPRADVRMVLRDYAYEIAPEIAAGRRTIRVENAAAQPHEVVVMKLAPGKTAQELLGWLMVPPQGPPPGTPVGGVTFISPGESNVVTADFTPGEYALFCFVPDAGDGKPHVAHGMVRQLTVR